MITTTTINIALLIIAILIIIHSYVTVKLETKRDLENRETYKEYLYSNCKATKYLARKKLEANKYISKSKESDLMIF